MRHKLRISSHNESHGSRQTYCNYTTTISRGCRRQRPLTSVSKLFLLYRSSRRRFSMCFPNEIPSTLSSIKASCSQGPFEQKKNAGALKTMWSVRTRHPRESTVDTCWFFQRSRSEGIHGQYEFRRRAVSTKSRRPAACFEPLSVDELVPSSEGLIRLRKTQNNTEPKDEEHTGAAQCGGG